MPLPTVRRALSRSLSSAMRLAAALATAVALVGGCARSDTVVQVSVQGNLSGIMQLAATVTVAAQTRSFTVPAAPRAIPLPTSFTVQLARSLSGGVDVAVDALDGAAQVIAHGTGSLAALDVGHTNQVVVNLTPGGGAPDGGTADGATSDAADAGAGGAAGTGGVSGGGGLGGGAGGDGSGSGGAGTGGDATGGASGGGGGGGAGGGGAADDDAGVDGPEPDA